MSKNIFVFSEQVTNEVTIVKDLVKQFNEQIDKLKSLGVITSIRTDDIFLSNSIIGVKVKFSVEI